MLRLVPKLTRDEAGLKRDENTRVTAQTSENTETLASLEMTILSKLLFSTLCQGDNLRFFCFFSTYTNRIAR